MRLNKERQKELEPQRMEYATRIINSLGYDTITKDDNCIYFNFKNEVVKFFPYTGWASGKSICDGRGLLNLLNQLK